MIWCFSNERSNCGNTFHVYNESIFKYVDLIVERNSFGNVYKMRNGKKLRWKKENANFCKLYWAYTKQTKNAPGVKISFYSLPICIQLINEVMWAKEFLANYVWSLKWVDGWEFLFIHFYFIQFLWIALQRHFEKPKALQTRIRLSLDKTS